MHHTQANANQKQHTYARAIAKQNRQRQSIKRRNDGLITSWRTLAIAKLNLEHGRQGGSHDGEAKRQETAVVDEEEEEERYDAVTEGLQGPHWPAKDWASTFQKVIGADWRHEEYPRTRGCFRLLPLINRQFYGR